MDVLLPVLRTVAQALVGFLVAQLAAHGMEDVVRVGHAGAVHRR